MILVVMGVAGCGKSTVASQLAQALGWRFLEGDCCHPAANRQKMAAGQPLSEADRDPWLQLLCQELRRAREQGENLALACSALKRGHRQRLRQAGADQFIFLAGSAELIASRLAARPAHFMTPALLPSQLQALEPPQSALRVDIQLPPAAQVALICRLLGFERAGGEASHR